MKRLILAALSVIFGCGSSFGVEDSELPMVEVLSVAVDVGNYPAVHGEFRLTNRTDRMLYVRVNCGTSLERQRDGKWSDAALGLCLSSLSTQVAVGVGQEYRGAFGMIYDPSWSEGPFRLRLDDLSDRVTHRSASHNIPVQLRLSDSFRVTLP